MNIVPRTGGNRISGSVFFSATGEKFQGSNVTPELTAAGLAAATPLQKVYDLNAAGGGPIKQDKVWYFANARTQGSTRLIAGAQVKREHFVGAAEVAFDVIDPGRENANLVGGRQLTFAVSAGASF